MKIKLPTLLKMYVLWNILYYIYIIYIQSYTVKSSENLHELFKKRMNCSPEQCLLLLLVLSNLSESSVKVLKKNWGVGEGKTAFFFS